MAEKNRKYIIGISAYFHDSAAVLLYGETVVAAAQEERFSRKKNDDAFPLNAIKYVLQECGISITDIDEICFYEKPFLRFERILETYFIHAPKGFLSFLKVIPMWIKEKLYVKKRIRESLQELGSKEELQRIPILFSEHHLSHAASAFYPSPFDKAAILTVDGVGEWVTTSISEGKGEEITRLLEIHFPHSIGLLYSSFTYFCGFKVNSGEYKLMGLTSYGDRESEEVQDLVKIIETHLVTLYDSGAFRLNLDYFTFATTFKMIDEQKWEKLFGVGVRNPEDSNLHLYINIALAAQIVTEKMLLSLVKKAKQLTGLHHLVLAGGVALNCVANEKIKHSKIFEKIWIQPASGDAGGALGAALAAHYIYGGNSRQMSNSFFNPYLGPQYQNDEVEKVLVSYQLSFKKYSQQEIIEQTSCSIAEGKVIGWFQGRMEWGPRALGNRSIIGNAKDEKMQKRLNLAVKKRESFRPFAPAVLQEDASRIFVDGDESPYMLQTTQVQSCWLCESEQIKDDLYFTVSQKRSEFPAITHIDYSARVQTVSEKTNPLFHQLLMAVKEKLGEGVIINTSFNVRGEPIVCSVEDAVKCFLHTDIDILVCENYIVQK